MTSLLAYIPVLNQRHLNWLKKHEGSKLFLIHESMAEKLLPRLSRNMSAIPSELMLKCIRQTGLVSEVGYFLPSIEDPDLESKDFQNWILPDEDICHIVSEQYLIGCNVTFEMIWARWDMTAVHKEQPVIPDVIISSGETDLLCMEIAQKVTTKSPDWWRQIGAMVWTDSGIIVTACNTHMPNEYETYIFGDPRLNVDAGQKGVYTALHAERAIVALCARHGIPLSGASLRVTTFPCEDCAREVAFAGIKQVFFRDGYSVLNAQEVLRSRSVKIIQVRNPGSA